MSILSHKLSFVFLCIGVFGYSQAGEKVGHKIDSVITTAIRAQAFPGCVVYVGLGDSTLFLRSYGYHTYDSLRRVAVNDIYDIASITKVVGGTLALMKLYESGHFALDDPIGDYLPGLGKKVGKVTFREALAHQGGLYPWIPFHTRSRRSNGTFKKRTVTKSPNEDYPFAITDSLYLHADFYKKIKKMIRKSKISKDKTYRYSGLFFYLIPELVQSLTDTLYVDYLDRHFYKPLGAKSLTFNPTEKFELSQIVPTEIDTFFRMESIHGKVHDEGAIMMRGISANAGLFSNAFDLAKIFEMLLKNGTLDSVHYLDPQTIRLFTTAQYPSSGNRRGLGFDKPLLSYDVQKSSVARSASFESYGHTGYTGTLAWADPENDLIFIFLTNRVYPDRTHRAIYNLNIRPTIHQYFYNILMERKSQKLPPVEYSK